MSKPKRQHTIPESYLKNFSYQNDRAQFVETKDLKSGEIKQLSIKDVCVSKNIYTFSDGEIKRYDLEHFYANNIDGVYPEVYNMLVNPNVRKINHSQKHDIISTVLSMYFRTTKFWNLRNRMTDHIIDHIASYAKEDGMAKGHFEDELIEFHISEIDDIKKKYSEKNRLMNIQTHFEQWRIFVKYKLEDGIAVHKSNDGIPYITSDNPVTIRSIDKLPYNIFNPTNIIKLPLDHQHSLYIGRKVDDVMLNTIFRQEYNKEEPLVSNLSVEQQAEQWIIGRYGHIHQHVSDQAKYGADTPENQIMVDNMEKSKDEMMKLSELAEKYGIHHLYFASQIRKMSAMEIFKNDPEFQKTLIELTRLGVPVF